MPREKYTKFLILSILIHLALFFAGYVFVGIEYSSIVCFLWGCAWIIYCNNAASKWDNEEQAEYEDTISTPALALVGGPLCWIIYPTCLLPNADRLSSGFSYGWRIASRILDAFVSFILKFIKFLYNFCYNIFPAE